MAIEIISGKIYCDGKHVANMVEGLAHCYEQDFANEIEMNGTDIVCGEMAIEAVEHARTVDDVSSSLIDHVIENSAPNTWDYVHVDKIKELIDQFNWPDYVKPTGTIDFIKTYQGN